MILTYRYRVKDGSRSTRRALRKQARAVNFVWNFCVETDRESVRRWKSGMNVRRLSAFDLGHLCRGVTKELGIHSDTIDAICKKFVTSRRQCFPKTPKFRSAKRDLGWIPFSKFSNTKLSNSKIRILSKNYKLWYSRGIPEEGIPITWCFSQDNLGNWFVNIQVRFDEIPQIDESTSVGVDLGLHDLATLSNGQKIAHPRFYRSSQERLAQYQRRKQKKRAKALHRKIANQRKHFLHVESTKIVREFDLIAVGDVSSSKLGKTRMAKSVYDSGWAMFRNFLAYKAIALGKKCVIVREAYTSQTCSTCGCLPESRPRGIAGLSERTWRCDDCGTVHDRDMNAAINILRLGAEHGPPSGGIPVSPG